MTLGKQWQNEFEASSTPLVTLSLFSFTGAHKLWALQQMGTGRLWLQQVAGLQFWKLLGTGKGLGFSKTPDFSRYGFLGVWDSQDAANEFLTNSAFINQYQKHSWQTDTFYLAPVKAKGLWSGVNPFSPVFESHPDDEHIAVLTRASIRWRKLLRFWQHVPQTSQELENAKGLKYSIGLGEAPFKHQATFSIWESQKAMEHFAYQSRHHQSVIQKTRSEDWYSEDLFSRFLILSNPLSV